MKKLLLILALFAIIISCSSDDDGDNNDNSNNYPENIYEGNVGLNSQIQIDEFGLNNYTKINGSLYIDPGVSLVITDLQPLNSLNFVLGNFKILQTHLQDFTGLENLTTVGGYLDIRSNTELESFNGLNNLVTVGGFFIMRRNYNTTDISALNNLTTVGQGFKIRENHNLISLNGLNNVLTNANSMSITIEINQQLSDFCSIENLLISDPNIYFNAIDNYYNPTTQDIIDGNCSL